MVIKFSTKFSYKSKKSVFGTDYEFEYKMHYDEKGVGDLIVIGKRPVYDKIQTFKDDVSIYKILKKYFGGDVSVLDKNKGFYADITQIPDSWNGFHNKILEGQNIWNGLPTDLKSKFNNDLNQFISSVYDNSFTSKYEEYKNEVGKPVVVSTPVVVKDEGKVGDSNE